MFDAFASWPQGRTAALPAESCRGKPALQPRAAPINPLQRAQPSAAAAMPPQRPDAPEARGTFSASVSTSPSRCGSSSTQGPPDVRDRLRGGPAVVSRPLAPTTARTNNSSQQQQVVGPARHAPVMRSIHHRVPFTREKPPAAALEEEPGRWTADQPGKCPAGQVRDNADRTRDVADRVSRTFPGRSHQLSPVIQSPSDDHHAGPPSATLAAPMLAGTPFAANRPAPASDSTCARAEAARQAVRRMAGSA
jgi:hypothetical protein